MCNCDKTYCVKQVEKIAINNFFANMQIHSFKDNNAITMQNYCIANKYAKFCIQYKYSSLFSQFHFNIFHNERERMRLVQQEKY